MRKHLSVREFKGLVRSGELSLDSFVNPKTVPDICLVKQYSAEIKALSPDAGNRTLLFTVSTGAVDREGDSIAPAGWDLTQYLLNPVVLWCHSYHVPPIGSCPGIAVEGQALMAQVEFPPPGRFQFSDDVFDMYAGLPRANGDGLFRMMYSASVGFIPTRWEYVDTDGRWGVDFLEQTLLEWSAVTVPANYEAIHQPPTTDQRMAGAAEEPEPASEPEPEVPIAILTPIRDGARERIRLMSNPGEGQKSKQGVSK